VATWKPTIPEGVHISTHGACSKLRAEAPIPLAQYMNARRSMVFFFAPEPRTKKITNALVLEINIRNFFSHKQTSRAVSC
jgi:hypothetical protein